MVSQLFADTFGVVCRPCWSFSSSAICTWWMRRRRVDFRTFFLSMILCAKIAIVMPGKDRSKNSAG